MQILLTNDDGVYAPGLWAAAEALKEVGEVLVAAPDRERSGIGAAVTLHQPVRAALVSSQIEGIKTYAVEGTPADCVILALESLAEGSIDLVVSGINQGANLGEDVLISGTVGAALHGYLRNLPSLAVSVASLTNLHYQAAALLTKVLARAVAENFLPRPCLLNVNLPNLPLERLEGIAITRMGSRSHAETVSEGNDGRRSYFWIKRSRPVWQVVEGTDIWAVRNNRVSITPLSTHLTATDQMSGLEKLAEGIFRALRPT